MSATKAANWRLVTSVREIANGLTVTSRTGTLKITGDGGKWVEALFHEGQIWSLSASSPDAEEAFYGFLGWTSGQFSFQPVEKLEGERTFFKDTTSLLLEGMRRMDDRASGRLPVGGG